MNYVKVCRGGVLEVYTGNQSKVIPMDSDSALRVLNKKIIIDPDLTLQDYFELFITYPVFGQLEDFLDNFIDRYKDEKLLGFPSKKMYNEDEDDWIHLTHIVLSKKVDVNKSEPMDVESYIEVSGKGIYLQDDEDEQYKKGDICESCGIELSDFITMLDCKLELTVPSVNVYKNRYNYCTDKYTFSVSENDSGYTLFEFITSIIWELSFFGCPCSVDEQAQELRDTVENIENGEEELIELTKDSKLFQDFDENAYVKKQYLKKIAWLKEQIKNAEKDKKFWNNQTHSDNIEILNYIDKYIEEKNSEIEKMEQLLKKLVNELYIPSVWEE